MNIRELYDIMYIQYGRFMVEAPDPWDGYAL